MWRCSFGVVNCPICKRAEEAQAERELKEKRRKRIEAGLAAGTIRAVTKNGKVVFEGLTAAEREGASDECIFRAIMVSGSALSRATLTNATSGRVRCTHQH